MKRIILLLFATMAVMAVGAANYSVTVTTQKQIRWVEQGSGKEVATSTSIGNTLTFEVVADTPREAENKALLDCGTACNSGVEVLAESGVSKNGKICDKYVKTVPWKADAKLR